MAIAYLDEKIWFPNPALSREDGLLAVGGDLSIPRLLLAYRNGIFPWYNPGEEILWWCPRERFVIFPEEIIISHSMHKFLKKTHLEVTVDDAFSDVIHQCRTIRERAEGTWITDEMEEAYNQLHRAGYAFSVETWQQEKLVGGLYGVSIGRCFFGESMFSLVSNASKMALIYLARILEAHHYVFIDCQFHTHHLASLGGRYITWRQYTELLRKGLSQ